MTALASRVAVITGAAGALGSAIARRLGAEGATLVLLDISAPGLEAQASALAITAQAVLPIQCDLGQEAPVEAAVEQVRSKFGRCDVLVNNVGFLPKASSFERITTETWDRAFAVNLRSAFLCARGFGAMMLERRSGSVINIGSTAASLPNSSASYAISKAALVALSRQLAIEWGPRGVRSNVVSPGFLLTPLSEHFYANEETRTLRERTVALRRIGTPEDIASTVAFLASDAASYVTGQELIVDGGQLQTALMLLQPERAAYVAGQPWP
jgi:NAD(P)-dependent dehydrogenase (short-subunit alcohol dehydrogenase family)